MSASPHPGPVLLCFDGSEHAAEAIARAVQLLGSRAAVVATAREPVELWASYDPASLVDVGIARLASGSLGLDEIADEIAQQQLDDGVALARAAGFEAEGRMVRGKAWRALCDLAEELDASVIVLGARGLSRVQSALLGSVSSAVSAHTRRPVLIIHRDGQRSDGERPDGQHRDAPDGAPAA
jgi:nucleotide-binding universal stress UspA family protein